LGKASRSVRPLGQVARQGRLLCSELTAPAPLPGEKFAASSIQTPGWSSGMNSTSRYKCIRVFRELIQIVNIGFRAVGKLLWVFSSSVVKLADRVGVSWAGAHYLGRGETGGKSRISSRPSDAPAPHWIALSYSPGRADATILDSWRQAFQLAECARQAGKVDATPYVPL
jgi:hypothetical protein